MIGFTAPYTFTQFGTTRNTALSLSTFFQFTVAHALGFSVCTSRILATDLSQSHCYFKSHMKSSCHSLISFLPFPPADNSEGSNRLLSATVFYLSCLLCPFIVFRSRQHRKHSLYCWRGVFTTLLPSNRRPIIARFRFAGVCLPSRCLALCIHVTIWSQMYAKREKQGRLSYSPSATQLENPFWSNVLTTTMTIYFTVFRDVTPCSPAVI
jgi:hypothetical protein